MALVLLRDENEGRDKHVESTLFPRLDEGSIPSSSTKKGDDFCHLLFCVAYPFVHGTGLAPRFARLRPAYYQDQPATRVILPA